MGKIAFVFSGQGAQCAGMGKSFYENSTAVRTLFDEVEKLRPGTLDMCFNGTPQMLKRTENTQPCLYLVALGGAIALSERGISPCALAGFSLGEVAALAYGGAFSYLDGFKLACERGKIMQEAANSANCGMSAVLKLENGEVERLCREIQNLYPVNYNSNGQLVVAGLEDSLRELAERVRPLGGKAVPLEVAGAFHSPFMSGASDVFRNELNKVTLQKPKVPVYSNLTARPYDINVCDTLAKQMKSPVLWERTIKNMADDGVDTFIECGIGNVLQRLVHRILPDATCECSDTFEKMLQIEKEMIPNA